MRVHHLNCASFCLRPGALFSPEARVWSAVKLVCHCLLIESGQGLVLVDTGLGLTDIAEPHQRLGRLFCFSMGAVLDAGETALRQVERLGFSASDVRDIVLTHLDLDHAGGISDFPKARVHVLSDELDAATSRRTAMEKMRYRDVQWAYGPEWVRHAVSAGERWFGFEQVQALSDAETEVLLVPTAGHTRGHAAIAVRTHGKWLLHAGDAYFFRGEMESKRRCPIGFNVFQRVIAVNDKLRRHNQARLRQCVKEHGTEVDVFCAHDPVEFEQIGGAYGRP